MSVIKMFFVKNLYFLIIANLLTCAMFGIRNLKENNKYQFT